ncbi:MAG: hypothetical protein PHQ12_06340 [Chthoniobacteraceae bacterium]|nr:hypothetical protein [Chthoniobacteraceae bacterium]
MAQCATTCHMKPKELRLSREQAVRLERIAAVNGCPADALVSLAVDALIAEAARHGGWLPLPSPASAAMETPPAR